jgi:glycine betaine/choline ABC-type transport system substrate-binding protein
LALVLTVLQPVWRRAAAAALVALAAAGVAGCGEDRAPADRPAPQRQIAENPSNAARPPFVVGSKAFTEQFILAEIYAQALAAAGYRASARTGVGDEAANLRALRRGEIQAYPEYTGTVLTTIAGVPPERVPKGPARAWEMAGEKLAPRGLRLLPFAPVNDANGFAMRQEQATALGVQRLSDLRRLNGTLVLSGPPECRERPDCLKGLEDGYGLRFKAFREVPLPDRHKPLAGGTADVGLVFTTDGRIPADNLVLLDDDRGLLPPYNVALVVDERALRAAGPDLPRVVAAAQRGLTTRVMQELNARVDLDGEAPAAVAEQYLRSTGLVGGAT